MLTRSDHPNTQTATAPKTLSWWGRIFQRFHSRNAVDDDPTPQLRAQDLPLAQYLDKEKTFDLLAIIEGGFSHLATRETQTSTSSLTESISNAAAILGLFSPFIDISLGRSSLRSSDDARHQLTRENLVHTAVSLFARLRNELHRRDLVVEIQSTTDLKDVSAGDFVEFQATFQRSKFDEVMDLMNAFAPLLAAFGVGRPAVSTEQTSPDVSSEQIKPMIDVLSGEGLGYLVASVGDMRFVVTVRDDHFIDPNINDVLDGTFRVFGKVVRVIMDENGGETINILRSSPLSRISTGHDALASMSSDLAGVGSQDALKDTVINGPTIQVIPIAIFA